MAEVEVENLRTDRWSGKTDDIPGMVFDEDGNLDETGIPETRYQVLGPEVYILQVWKDGTTGRGLISLDDYAKQLGRPVTKEGWYDHAGKYLGDDPGLE